MLRHLANLQAPTAPRQGSPPFLSERFPGLSVSTFSPLFAMQVHSSTRTTLAPAPSIYNSRDAPWLCAGWPASMIRPLITKLQFILGLVFVAAAFPHALRAQLVRETTAPPQQKASPTQDPQNPASPQKPPGNERLSQELQLTGENSWIDTTIDIQAGEHVLITATGQLRYADAKDDNGPDGLPRGFRDLLRILPFNEAGRGALIGRIGEKDTTQPFAIGARRDVIAPVSGRLSVGINQTADDTGDGNYAVRIEVYSPEAGTARVVAKQVSALPGVDNNLFSKIPRRISDKEGNSGDMVNFLILGPEVAIQRVFTNAGWVKVDADVKDTVLHGIIGSLSKESYLTMPMSQLYLFGRPQDYGWAHAEPLSVVRSRNHLRVWKAPFQVKGETLWVGAATHDIGFERDQRNDGITHKIDPDIDIEREYLEKTLSSTGLVAEVSHILPDNPMKEAKTATGGAFHSNGRVLVLKLADSGKDASISTSASHKN